MKRKLFALVICIVVLFSFAGCFGNNGNNGNIGDNGNNGKDPDPNVEKPLGGKSRQQ